MSTSSADGSMGDHLRGERTMVRVRWIAAAWAAAQVYLYDAMAYPAGIREAAYGLVAVLVAGNVVLWWGTRTVTRRRTTWWLAVGGLAFEVAVASAFVWLYAFDPTSALWVVLFLVPVAGAARLGLVGALGSWVAVAGLYVGRELWAASHWGVELSVSSVTFRCGMLGLVALVVGWLTRDLVVERERARQLEQWRGRLVAVLAHDIRSPLAAADMALAGLDRSALGEEDRGALVAVARRQVARVLTLARDLLDLAAADRGTLRLHRAPTVLSQIVVRAVTYVDPDGTVRVDVPDGLVVDVDQGRIEQVLINLVANATSHGRPPVVICARRDGEQVAVSVRDHGDGVPPDVQPRLFEPFATAGDTDVSSVGLGLWIAAQMTRAHGGQISYRTEPDGGAAFTVTMPAADGTGPTAEDPSDTAQVEMPGPAAPDPAHGG